MPEQTQVTYPDDLRHRAQPQLTRAGPCSAAHRSLWAACGRYWYSRGATIIVASLLDALGIVR